MQQRLINSSLLIASILISALFLEGTVRHFFPAFDPSGQVAFHCKDGAYIGPRNAVLRQRANTGEFDVSIAFNQFGFRDAADLTEAKPNDLFVVGDSFSFGHGVEKSQRYSDLLARNMDVAVFNISISNNLDGYYWLVNYAEKHGTRINNLIVGLCMENDIKRYAKEIQHCVPTDPIDLTSLLLGMESISTQRIKMYLRDRSATYNMLTTIIHQNPFVREMGIKMGLIYENTVFPGNHVYDEKALRQSAQRIKDIVQDRSAIVLIIPSRGLWQGSNTSIENKIHKRFVEFLKNQNIAVVDMKPFFESSGDPLRFHYKLEGHWNSLGHAKAAEEIAARLRKKRINKDGVSTSRIVENGI